MKTEKIQEIIKRISEINKTLIYNYHYTYFDLAPAGSPENSIISNGNLNEKFGPSRKGYELFKEEYDELRVGYSGITSMREIELRKTSEVIGYIMETKQPTRPYIQEADVLYDEVYDEFISILEVNDEESLLYYIKENGPGYEFGNNDRVNEQLKKASFLMSILSEYTKDDEFKRFFDKIIK